MHAAMAGLIGPLVLGQAQPAPQLVWGEAVAPLVADLQAWQPGWAEHPFVFLGPAELEAVRARRQQMPEAYAGLARQADDLLPREAPADPNQAAWEAVPLALIARLDGRPECAAAAWARIAAALDHGDWVMPPHKPLQVDLGYATIAENLALAFDWSYPDLSAEQRARGERDLAARLDLYRQIQADQSEWWAKAVHNWRTVICGDMGVVALVLRDADPQWRDALALSIEGVVASLEDNGQDGSYNEGVGYWGYGVGQGGIFAAALKSATAGRVDLFRHPYLAATGDFSLHFATPDGGSFGFEDGSHSDRPNPWLVALLAREYQRSDLQWLARSAGDQSLWTFLFTDPALPAQPTGAATGRFFPNIQTAVTRTAWADDATFLGLHAGSTTVNHAHLDVGTFILSARGRRLVSDPGVWSYDHSVLFFNNAGPRWDYEANSSVGHNVVLVEGQGQHYASECRGEITVAQFSPTLDRFVCDAGAAYGGLLKSWVRYVVFAKPDAVLIVDHVVPAQPAHLSWLLHPEGTIKPDDTRFTITNEDAALDGIIADFELRRPAEGYKVGVTERETFYHDRSDRPVRRMNRYLSFESLHQVAEWVVPVLLVARSAEAPPTTAAVSLEREADVLTVSATGIPGGDLRATLDLAAHTVEAQR